MKKATQKVYWMLFLSAALIIPSFAQDNESAEKPAAGKGKRYEAIADRLNLTAEQRGKIKAIRENQMLEMAELREALKEARAKFKEQLDDPNSTAESVAPLAADLKAILARMVDKRVESVFAVKSILTPEQFSQIRQMKHKIRKDIGGRSFWPGKKRSEIMENNEAEDKPNE